MGLVGKKAPSFKANAVVNGGEIISDFIEKKRDTEKNSSGVENKSTII